MFTPQQSNASHSGLTYQLLMYFLTFLKNNVIRISHKYKSINRSTNVMYTNLQQNCLITIILKDKEHACISYVLTVDHWSNEIPYQEFCFFDMDWLFPTKCKMSYWIAWEGSNHLVFVNPTIDHPSMCPWHTIVRFHSIFHFQSF